MKTLRPEQVVEVLGVIAMLQGDTNKANFLASWAKEDRFTVLTARLLKTRSYRLTGLTRQAAD